MDKLAYLPMPVTTRLVDVQPTEPTTRDYLKLVPDPDVDVEEQVISQFEAARVRRLVGALPKLHRLVITWHFGLDGQPLSRREIGERLRLSPAVVRRIEAEALGHLRRRALAQGEAA